MAQFETFSAYFSRVVTPEALLFGTILMGLAFLIRKGAAQKLAVSQPRYLLISASIVAIVSLSIRFWDRVGTAENFWLFDHTLWAAAFTMGANWVLNVALYVPAAFLLVLARQPAWKVFVFLASLSAVIETVQLLSAFGNGDPADYVSNAVGTMLGILLGQATRRLMPCLGSRREPASAAR